MNHKRAISVEILRDIETPAISVAPAIEALEEIGEIIPLEIVEQGGTVRLTKRRSRGIRIDRLPTVNFDAPYGIVVTGRPLIVPREQILRPGNIVVGQTINQDDGRDYALMDFQRANSPKYLTKHETAHVLKVPREGEYFDGIYHCNNESCIMHVESSEHRQDFCHSCIRQLAAIAIDLSGNAA